MNNIRAIFVSAIDFSIGGAAQARQRAIVERVGLHGVSAALLSLQQNKGIQWALPVRHFSAGLRSLPWRLQLLLQLPVMLGGAALRRRPDVVMCYDRDPFILGITLLIARLLRIPVVHELTEYPDQVVKNDWYGRLTVRLFERLSVRMLAGALVISRALETYVKTFAPQIKTARVPAIASIAEDNVVFAAAAPARGANFHVTYTGSLSERKDGVVSLLHAFAAIDPRARSAHLSLYGHGTESQRAGMRSAIEALRLKDSVTLHDPVPHSKIWEILASSDLLVLARPISRQAQGGFPTKLAEYLAAGRPVLTTVTGDIGRYLRHNVDAYLVAPGDIEAFSRAILDAYSQRSAREALGKAARATAREHFCPDKAAAIVARWLKQSSTRIYRA